MRFVVFGAGAVGGVVGGRLVQAGFDVVLIARGAHGDEMARHGLRLHSPDGVERVGRAGRRPPVGRRPDRRRCRVVDREESEHGRSARRVVDGGRAVAADRVPAERGEQRARGAAALRPRVWGDRDVPDRAPRTGARPRLLEPDDGDHRRRPIPDRRRRERRGRRPGVGEFDVLVAGTPRRGSLEMGKADHQPGQRDRGGLWPTCPRWADRRPRPSRGGGRARSRWDRLRHSRGGPRPPRRLAADRAGRRSRPSGRVDLAEPRPGQRLGRDRLPQRRDRDARTAPRGADAGERGAAISGA